MFARIHVNILSKTTNWDSLVATWFCFNFWFLLFLLGSTNFIIIALLTLILKGSWHFRQVNYYTHTHTHTNNEKVPWNFVWQLENSYYFQARHVRFCFITSFVILLVSGTWFMNLDHSAELSYAKLFIIFCRACIYTIVWRRFNHV